MLGNKNIQIIEFNYLVTIYLHFQRNKNRDKSLIKSTNLYCELFHESLMHLTENPLSSKM